MSQAKLKAAVQRAKKRGLGVKATARVLGLSPDTVRRIRDGQSHAGSRTSGKALRNLKNNRAKLPPVLRAPIMRPPQLKQLDPVLWHKLRFLTSLWGLEICAVWWCTTSAELRAHVRSVARADEDPAAFRAKLLSLGIPVFTLSGRRKADATATHLSVDAVSELPQ